MKDRIRRICPCHRYNIEGIQTWLEDMAAEGWLLDGEKPLLGQFFFRKAHPQKLTYRLEPTKPLHWYESPGDPPAAEAIDMNAEFGWEFVRNYDLFYIYRTADPNARPLHTDSEIQAAAMNTVKKQLIIRSITVVLYLACLWLLRSTTWIYLFRNAVTVSPLLSVVLLAYLLWIGASCVCDILLILSIQHRLRRGDSFNRRRNWKRFAPVHKVNSVVPLVLICAIIGFAVLTLLADTRDAISITEFSGDVPFVTLTDLKPDGHWASVTDISKNTVQTWSNGVSTSYEWHEHATITADDGSEVYGIITINYHDTCSEWFAKGLADDYYNYTVWDGILVSKTTDLEPPVADVDSIRVFEKGLYTYYLIQEDNIVVFARILTLEDQDGNALDDFWLDAMLEMLEGGN